MIKPLGDRVVIKVLEKTDKTNSGIFLPESVQEKPQQGEVVSVGPGYLTNDGKRIPLQVSVGDNVYFAKYAGTEMVKDNKSYLIIKESDILAMIV